MTLEKFKHLAKTKKSLEGFLEFTEDKDFVGIASHTCMLPYNIYREITDKEIVDKIVELVQDELDKINKQIEGL